MWNTTISKAVQKTQANETVKKRISTLTQPRCGFVDTSPSSGNKLSYCETLRYTVMQEKNKPTNQTSHWPPAIGKNAVSEAANSASSCLLQENVHKFEVQGVGKCYSLHLFSSFVRIPKQYHGNLPVGFTCKQENECLIISRLTCKWSIKRHLGVPYMHKIVWCYLLLYNYMEIEAYSQCAEWPLRSGWLNSFVTVFSGGVLIGLNFCNLQFWS